MKIAQIVCAYPPYRSGIGKVAAFFHNAAKNSGFDSVVFTPLFRKAIISGEDSAIKRLKPWLEYGNAAFIPQLILKLRDFDIVHLHYPFFGGSEAVWLAKRFNAGPGKLIIHYHMDTPGLPFCIRPLSLPSLILKKSLFRCASVVTCASLDYVESSQIRKIYYENTEKFIELPFGVDENKYYIGNNIVKDGKSILFVGGLDKAHDFKGLSVLFGACRLLKTAGWRLRIAGSGELLELYRKQANKLGSGGLVEFLGGISDQELADEYRRASVFVLPSINRNEAFGLVLLEAMASGTPVVASDLPGVRKVFESGKQGYLAIAGDSSDLANKIDSILSRIDLRDSMGLAARRLVLEKYSQSKTADRLMEIYKKVYSNRT